MFRKFFASLMLVAALATAVGAVPGLAQSIAQACDTPSCCDVDRHRLEFNAPTTGGRLFGGLPFRVIVPAMTFRLLAFRLLSLVAVAVSTAMVLDAYLPAPAFCGFRAGCDEVTHSAFGKLAGIPLSLWGLVAFATFYTLTLFPDRNSAGRSARFAIVAGVVGLGLVAEQVFLLKQTCPFCLIIDTCGILLAAVELGLPPAKPPATSEVPITRSRDRETVIAERRATEHLDRRRPPGSGCSGRVDGRQTASRGSRSGEGVVDGRSDQRDRTDRLHVSALPGESCRRSKNS